MTAKEYLMQAYRLNEMIDSDTEELEHLRELSGRISGSNFGERVQCSRNTEPLLLTYRYFNNCTWEEIAERLHVSNRTVHRIHASALKNFSVPD